MTGFVALAVVGVGLLMSACATTYTMDPSASPAGGPFTPQAQCERDGGRWHADKNFCEYQSPGRPFRRL